MTYTVVSNYSAVTRLIHSFPRILGTYKGHDAKGDVS